MDNNKIVIVDLPVLTDRRAGTIANAIWLYSMCYDIPNRKTNRPAVIYIDEAQFLVNDELKMIQTISRSSCVGIVLLFQNIAVLEERFSKEAVRGLLSTINTFVFTRQSDAESRQWASDRIGKIEKVRETRNYGNSQSKGGGSSFSITKEIVRDYQFQPEDFSSLKRGGPENWFRVEAIVLTDGKAFRAKFHQICPGAFCTVKPQ